MMAHVVSLVRLADAGQTMLCLLQNGSPFNALVCLCLTLLTSVILL